MTDEIASAGKESLPLRRRLSGDNNPSAKQPTSHPKGSSDPDVEGNSSSRRSRMTNVSEDESMNSNRAQHSTTFSYTNIRGDLPDDYTSDAPSDQAPEFAPSNPVQGLRPQRKGPGSRSGTPRSRPLSRTATGDLGKVGSGSESRLRYSVNSTDDIGDQDEGASRQQHQGLRASPVSDEDRLPAAAANRHETGESADSLSYGQESARRLSKEQRPAGGSATDGGTTSHEASLQPETEPGTEQILMNESQSIYAGLVMVERRCIEIVQRLSQSETEVSNQEWQMAVNAHSVLLNEHHDFFLNSEHPEGRSARQRYVVNYAMPARLWRYGIHALLELLRQRLPDTLEHMLRFIYLAYSMITIFLETVPTFEDTWIECLGEISRYRMVVEAPDSRERHAWAGIARYWYNKGADKNSDVGRLQHHLGVLARPDIVQQLFYYTKSLVCVHSFAGTRESIHLLFTPLLQNPRSVRRLPEIVIAFVAAHGYLFTGKVEEPFKNTCDEYLSFLEEYIGRMGPNFKLQGVYIASCNFAAVLEYAAANAILPSQFSTNAAKSRSMDDIYHASRQFWTPTDDKKTIEFDFLSTRDSESPSPVLFYGASLAFQTLSIVLDQVGNKSVNPSLHVSLAFLWCLARTPSGIKYVEPLVPWKQIALFLNTLTRNFSDFTLIEGLEFPSSGDERWLPEDFLVRGQTWSQHFYPEDFFAGAPTADDGRNIEPPSKDLSRVQRCLWLGVRLALFNRWMTYDSQTKKFSVTAFASELESLAREHNLFFGKGQGQLAREIEMVQR
ncbi:hypothetical protein BDV18DRAFT_123447 [Aspergillus unguis]